MATPIGVCGWYNHGNIGDEAYKIAFPKIFPGCHFTFTSEPNNLLDTWILGGGDVVNSKNIEKFKSIKKKHIFSATVDEQCNLSGFSTVAVRDYLSLQIALDCKANNTLFVPDFTFALDADTKRGQQLIRSYFINRDLYAKVVVVVLNGYLMGGHDAYAKEYIRFQTLAYELAEIIDTTNASFIFIPFGHGLPTDDRISNGWSASKCKFWEKNYVVFDSLTVQDTIDIIAGADATISTRLHSSIFSCLCGTPFIDITHNHKNARFLSSINYNKYSANYRGFDPSKTKMLLSEILVNKQEISDNLKDITQKQKQLLIDFAKSVII